MALIKRGNVWWYEFRFDGQPIRVSAKTSDEKLARKAEAEHRRRLEHGYHGVEDDRKERKERAKPIEEMVDEYYEKYKREHESFRFMTPVIDHFKRLLCGKTVGQINAKTIEDYQTARLKADVSATTINMEVGILMRALGKHADHLKVALKRTRSLNLPKPQTEVETGTPYTAEEQTRIHEAAEQSPSLLIAFALRMQLNGGFRDKEIRTMRWRQVDFLNNIVQVGKSKSRAGTGRRVPMNEKLLPAFQQHAAWYVKKFGQLNSDWYVFPFGRPFEMDPKRPVTTFKTSWNNVRRKANVSGRWHDCRHTFITELLESGASPATVTALVGHVDERVMKHYWHSNTERASEAVDRLPRYRDQQLKKMKKLRAHNEAVAKSQHHPTVN
jgi:integrase